MIVGASLRSFRGLELEPAQELYLKLAKDFALSAVQISFEKEQGRPSIWPWEVDKGMRDFLAHFPVTVAHLSFAYLNPISPNPRIREESLAQLRMAIDRAAELGINYAIMHGRGVAYGLAHAQQIEEWVRVIAGLASYAGDRSIILTVENGDFLADLKELATLVRRINSSSLKITLDSGHAYVRRIHRQSWHLVASVMLRVLDMAPVPIPARKYCPYEKYGSLHNFLASEGDLVSGFHLHDHDGRKDHVALGSGKIDFSFLRTMNHFQGPLILEAEFQDHYSDFQRNYERLQRFVQPRGVYQWQ